MPLASALVAGGVRVLEVTLRTPVAIEAAKAIMADVPEAIVGIGTILNADDSRARRRSAPTSASAPARHPDLLKAAAASALPFAPGIATASELMQALAHGFKPRQILSGRAVRRYQGTARAGGAVSRHARFCPTGGIGEANAATWLAEPNVVAVGGSWLCPAADIRSGNWAGITAMCERAMKSLKPA